MDGMSFPKVLLVGTLVMHRDRPPDELADMILSTFRMNNIVLVHSPALAELEDEALEESDAEEH